MNPWWTEQASGLIFGALGGGIGVIGAMAGVVIGSLARQGKGKPVAMALHLIGAVVGVSSLVLAIAAVVSRQPYHVWYPPMMIGLIACGLFIGLWFGVVRNAYRQAEQRRLDAQMLRGS